MEKRIANRLLPGRTGAWPVLTATSVSDTITTLMVDQVLTYSHFLLKGTAVSIAWRM
jgi:hypothetical protein